MPDTTVVCIDTFMAYGNILLPYIQQ